MGKYYQSQPKYLMLGTSATVRLGRVGNVVYNLPSSAFKASNRMTVSYPGHPKLCHGCGEKRHFSSSSSALICSMFRARGHVAKDCKEIRCNLCLQLGYPFSQFLEAWHNMDDGMVEEMLRLDGMEVDGGTPSSAATNPAGLIQDSSPAPVITSPKCTSCVCLLTSPDLCIPCSSCASPFYLCAPQVCSLC